MICKYMNTIMVNPKKVLTYLLVVNLTFFGVYQLLLRTLAGYTAGSNTDVAGLFNVNAEVSIPTWYSQSILLSAAFLLLMISTQVVKQKKHWLWLGIIFVYLSIDEGASIHELTVWPMRKLLGVDSGLFYYSWIVLFGGLFVLFGALYLKFLMQLPRYVKYLFIISGTIFVCGAIGVEAFSGSIAAESGESGLLYGTLVGIEELLEMTGIALFIYALLYYLKTCLKPVKIK
jgi:hypothetical protein